MDPRGLLRASTLALVSLLILVGCSNADGSGGARPAAATVDGDEITDAEVATNVKLFTFLAGLNGAPCGTKVEGETDEAACARFAIGSLIEEHFVETYAKEHDLTVAQADKDALVGQLEQSLGGAQAVDDQLNEAGIGRPELDALTGRILLFQKVQEAVAAEQGDDKELRVLYQQNLLQFTTLDTQHILVKTEAEAQDAYDEVTARGATEEDFLALASKISTDPGAKQNSGAIGATAATGLDPAYAAAAAELEPGEISKPVQSQFGWHVIRLVSKDVQSFEDAKGSLAQQQGGEDFERWLSDAASAASIEVNPKYGRFNPETREVEAITSTATGSSSPSGAAASASGASAPPS